MWKEHKNETWDNPMNFIEEYGNNTFFKDMIDKLKEDHEDDDATIKDVLKELTKNKTA